MLAIEPNSSLLPVILLIIAVAIFVGTLLFVWQNRHAAATRRAARTSFVVALLVGLLALLYWAIRVNEPLVPLALIAIPLFFMGPAFVISFYLSSAWHRR